MKLETILTILITVAAASYMLRMMVNWVLLNRVNGKSSKFFVKKYIAIGQQIRKL